ncbi:MAG: hypothetical protein GY847_09245 [Proteobacteria bacterium]|nr:hypothetical protein [Pseudomonadota bacterium]
MTKSHKGKFASKHPENIEPNEQIAQAVKANLKEGKLSCAAAIRISKDLDVSMADVGRNADLLEVRICKCLYGLFGQDTPTGKKLPVEPVESVSKEMEKAIRDVLEDGCLTCLAGWEVSSQMGIKYGSLVGICENLKIKICHCQLGAF